MAIHVLTRPWTSRCLQQRQHPSSKARTATCLAAAPCSGTSTQAPKRAQAPLPILSWRFLGKETRHRNCWALGYFTTTRRDQRRRRTRSRDRSFQELRWASLADQRRTVAGRLTGCCPEAHFEVQNPGCEGQNPGYEGPMSLWVVFIPNLRWSSIGLNELLAELDRTSIGSRVKTSEFVWWFQCSAAFFQKRP